MLTQEEQDFLKYWSEQRLRKKKTLKQFSIGLPMGVMIVLAVFVNLLVGWHKKAAMVMKSNGSIIVTVIVAAVGIVVFMTIFSRNHQWDMYEQRYQELLQKQAQNSEPASSTPTTSN
jgi:membrane protein YdbS with pleckstrin-like domain